MSATPNGSLSGSSISWVPPVPPPAPVAAAAAAAVEAAEEEVVAARPAVARWAPARPTPGFWGSLGYVLVFILVTGFIPFFVAGIVSAVAKRPLSDFMEATLFSGQVLGAAVALALLYRKLGWGFVSELGLNRLPPVSTLLAVVAVPGLKAVLVGIVLALGLLFGATDPTAAPVAQAARNVPWWLAVLAIAVGPAVNEELWFRGYLGRGLVGRYGPTVGVLLASLFFGLAHLHPVQVAYAAVMGLWLHFAYRMTRSLWVPVIVHFLNNGLAVVVALLTATGASSSEPAPALTGAVLWTVIGVYATALVVFAAASWGIYKLRVR